MDIITNGGDPAFGSKMPAFGDELNERDIQAVLEFIKSRWEDEDREFQWWISNR